MTTVSSGKFNPAIYDQWVVWQDNRNTEQDIYGFDLLRNREVQITATPEDETQPRLNGPWLVCLDNALTGLSANSKLIHLPSLLAAPVTGTPTLKSLPALADGQVVWQETISNQSRIASVTLPSLQPVFQNRNALVVTPAMAAYAQNAFGLLSLWGTNGLSEITEYIR